MGEASPARNDEDMKDDATPIKDGGRTVATGALRRVFKQRMKRPASNLLSRRRGSREEDEGFSEGESEDEGTVGPLSQTTSNHYTLNMPAPAPPQSDLPYVLLGYVNSLILDCRTS